MGPGRSRLVRVTPLDHIVHIGRILDALDIPWVLGGSMASSIVGEPRSTMDVDVAVRLDLAGVEGLVAAVADEYYVSEDMVRDAVVRYSAFNLIHFATGMKVDVFALSDDPLDVRQMARRERVEMATGEAIWVGAADDQVLRKLRWFRLGGEVSERQWRDVVSILVVQGARIDHHQLLVDAGPLGVADLVERVLAEVNRRPPGNEFGGWID
jgi:hypothetical protein